MTATGNENERSGGNAMKIDSVPKAALDALPADDPILNVRRQKNKIAIVGFTEHRNQALALDRDEWALWGLNELYRYMPLDRFDLWCEIHDWDTLATETNDEVPPPWPRHVEVMANGFDGHPATKGGFSVPIYMQKRRPDVRLSHTFPKDFVESDLGDYGPYKTSAPAWMLGLAIALNFEEINLYGIDMATDTEYAQQRPCMEFLMGAAVGRGIKVKVPPTSDLTHSVGQYAFGTGDYFTAKLIERKEWLNDQLKSYQNLHAKIEAAYSKKRAELDEIHRVEKSRCEGQIHEIIGQLQNTQYMERAWAVPVAQNAVGPHPDRTKDPRTGITEDSILGRGDGVTPVPVAARTTAPEPIAPVARPAVEKE